MKRAKVSADSSLLHQWGCAKSTMTDSSMSIVCKAFVMQLHLPLCYPVASLSCCCACCCYHRCCACFLAILFAVVSLHCHRACCCCCHHCHCCLLTVTPHQRPLACCCILSVIAGVRATSACRDVVVSLGKRGIQSKLHCEETDYLLLTWARGGSKENEGKDPLKPEATTY